MPITDTRFDLLVVGSGAAGLSAALRAAELGANVAVLTAGALLAGSSPRAQGGVAAALGADDTALLHARDTLKVGAGLNDASAVDVLTRVGRTSVRSLRAAGVPFAEDLGLEAGHARRRILHAGGGATGQVLTSALLDRAQRTPRIALVDHSPVSTLDVQAGRAIGVHVGQRQFRANATVLATGGYAALWGRTTNAPETRGSGIALAYAAGATLADLEFVQFHPTALALDDAPALLLSEALRGEGARLIDDAEHEIVNPLLPRDVLARALHRELSAGRRVYLSLRHLDPEQVYAHFSALAQSVQATSGLDLARDRLPVAPAAHYCMGGIRTDTWGRTDMPGLYAAGETACSGAQGANRLASNSLLECLVFGSRTAEAALGDTPDAIATWSTRPLPASAPQTPPSETVITSIAADALGAHLDTDVGVERSRPRLTHLIRALPTPDAAASSDLLLASLVARAALLRTESRGAHFRTDAPTADPAWRGRIHWRSGRAPVFEEVFSESEP